MRSLARRRAGDEDDLSTSALLVPAADVTKEGVLIDGRVVPEDAGAGYSTVAEER